MLSRFDDYPIQQAPIPIARPVSTDQNAYGRYWFGAFHRGGDFIVEAAFGRYPNLGVVDGSVSIVVDGVQDAFHASGAAPADPTHTFVGPLRLEIVEPMRELRLVVEPNQTGMSADLIWRSRVGALQEDHTTMEAGERVIVDMLRFVQFGTWSGTVTVDNRTVELSADEVVGVRDRSWGIRPVGQQPQGRPASSASNCWIWAPLHFEAECRSLGYFERPGGEMWRADGFRLPVVDPVPEVMDHQDPGVYRIMPRGQRFTFAPGTRWITRAEIDTEPAVGPPQVLELEPMLRFHMRGLGYHNPEWGHGHWKGDLAVGRETWKLDEVDPADPSAQHVHHAVRARIGDQVGVGVLEQIIFGPHVQFGFHDMLDAP
jgi:hypothetical protein